VNVESLGRWWPRLPEPKKASRLRYSPSWERCGFPSPHLLSALGRDEVVARWDHTKIGTATYTANDPDKVTTPAPAVAASGMAGDNTITHAVL
jgi:hypothetical protein